MLIFLFIVLLILSIFFTSNFAKKNSLQKRQIILLTRQNRDLKERVDKNNIILDTITVEYLTPDVKKGTIAEACNLYIAPTDKYAVLSQLNKNTELEIWDSAEVSGTLWYEVSYSSNKNINNKGWIRSENITIYDSTLNDQ